MTILQSLELVKIFLLLSATSGEHANFIRSRSQHQYIAGYVAVLYTLQVYYSRMCLCLLACSFPMACSLRAISK